MVRAMLRARDVLGPGSAVATALEGGANEKGLGVEQRFGAPNPPGKWEHREGQLAMAEAVERALEREHHLFVEAGTGTGKTLAYLVPALLSGRKVVVSTATRALQDQIYTKDLPVVAEALATYGVHFRATLMKGLSNYLCRRRMNEAKLGGKGGDLDLARIFAWASESHTGDRAELGDLPEEAAAWREVASSSETRIGSGCAYFDDCFVTRVRREAEEADLLVVNHHLLLADLALRTGPRGAHASVLPPYDAVIFDEAHQIEDIATDFFGTRVSNARADALVRDAEASLAAAGALEPLRNGSVRALLDGVREATRALFAELARAGSSGDSRRTLSEADMTPAWRGAHGALDTRLEALETLTRARSEEALQAIARRTGDLRDDLRTVLSPADADAPGEAFVRWIDVRQRSVSLGASPVEVGAKLRRRLFDRVPTVICTSATLASAGGFHFARARLGAPPEAEELIVASPFDFSACAALYLPRDLPEPSDPAFEDAAADRVEELVRLTGGGAFVLCTSRRAMEGLHRQLARRAVHPLMMQGERPKHLLLARFRASGRAVLVATMSFWEGVDVPGWALRLVVLDKIPFAPPNDPVVAARCARLDREGGNGFTQYSVPMAAMTLKQGFGRLIRTQRDAGIVAVLDRRIATKGYGRALLAGLPPASRVASLDDVARFYAKIAAGRTVAAPAGTC
jgi:ATP-dependent DNA helicase DinG